MPKPSDAVSVALGPRDPMHQSNLLPSVQRQRRPLWKLRAELASKRHLYSLCYKVRKCSLYSFFEFRERLLPHVSRHLSHIISSTNYYNHFVHEVSKDLEKTDISRGIHSPKLMLHTPLFQISLYFKTFSPNFTFFQKQIRTEFIHQNYC